MTEKITSLNLNCGGRPCESQLLGLTLVREIGRIPFLRTRHEYRDEDAGLFRPGAEITFQVKAGELSADFKGVVTNVGLNLAGGTRVLTMTARDPAQALTLARSTALFLDKSDAEISRDVISGHGLSADIPDTSPKHRQMQQALVSDWDFLLSRLWASGLVPVVRSGKVKALKLDSLGNDHVLEIDAASQALLELELEADDRAWFKSVSASAWDDAAQKVVKGQADEARPPQPGSLKGHGRAEQEIPIPQVLVPAELSKLSEGLLWRLRQGFISGRVRLAGLAGAEPGHGLKLKNCGPLADGRSAVWANRLEIKGGECFTDLQFGYEFIHQLQTELQAGGLSGILGGSRPELPGLYPAKVIKLVDPDKGQRIAVHIPLLHKAGQSVWARAAQVYAGPGRAVVFRPEQDDEVLVGFLGADPGAPVILGALPSKAHQAPKELEAIDEKNHHKGWVSRNGLSLLLDEETKSVLLKTPGGQSLEINDKESSIALRDKNGNVISLDKGGITLKSKSNIQLEAAKNITLKAAADLKGQGLSCQLQGQKDIKLSGQAMGELSTSGLLTVKGTLVKIN